MRFSLLIILLTLILVGCESSPRSVILHPSIKDLRQTRLPPMWRSK